MVFDIAIAALTNAGNELLEQGDSIGVFHVQHDLAVELLLGGVHHHAPVHVIDPEIVVLVVTQLGNLSLGEALRFIARHLAGLLLLVSPVQGADGDLDFFLEGIPPLLLDMQEAGLHLPGNQHHKWQEQHDRDQPRLVREGELSKQSDAWGPEAVMLEKACLGIVSSIAFGGGRRGLVRNHLHRTTSI